MKKNTFEKILLILLALAALAFGEEVSVATQVAMNTTQTLLSQLSDLFITTIIAIITYYIKEFLQTSSFVKKYNLDNEKTERLLANAISYAESNSKKYVNENITKRDLAIKYLEKVSPTTVNQFGEIIHDMLDRKVEQLKVAQQIRNQTPVQ